MRSPAENRLVASRLREAAALLRGQGASPYRANAYRDAAESIEKLPRDVRNVFDTSGVKGLDEIPKVGLGIASAVAEMLATGHWAQLERLRGSTEPERLLQSVPGIGPQLAQMIHTKLNVESLEALEVVANDGRLDALPGVGTRRAAAIRATVAEMLGRVRTRPIDEREHFIEPEVEAILDVDREYRERAAHGELRLIAPKRFNPDGAAWLPILHTARGAWHFTALYSNTALAHRLGRIHDWVVVYFYDGDEVEHSRTVVTEHRGSLAGTRVVRGREDECRRFLESRNANDSDHVAQHPALDRAA